MKEGEGGESRSSKEMEGKEDKMAEREGRGWKGKKERKWKEEGRRRWTEGEDE